VEISGSTRRASGNASAISITDNGPQPPTRKDDAHAGDVLKARRMLLESPEMRTAIDKLHGSRPQGNPATWQPRAGLDYWLAVGELADRTDRLFSQVDLDDYARRWAELKEQPYITVGIGFAAGREGRPRRMMGETIELAVRSIALRVAGETPTAADNNVSHAYQAQSAPGVYRKRLRDRL
jgi:hypothetical protein